MPLTNDARIHMRLPAELKDRVHAAAPGGDMSAFLRDAAREKLERQNGTPAPATAAPREEWWPK